MSEQIKPENVKHLTESACGALAAARVVLGLKATCPHCQGHAYVTEDGTRICAKCDQVTVAQEGDDQLYHMRLAHEQHGPRNRDITEPPHIRYAETKVVPGIEATCPHCQGPAVVTEDGSRYCAKCDDWTVAKNGDGQLYQMRLDYEKHLRDLAQQLDIH